MNEKTPKKDPNNEPILDIDFETTAEISVPPRLIDRVIGQDHAVKIASKAAIQRRHMSLIGEPGLGKSMIGQALTELLPKEKLEDLLCLPNTKDPNNPRIISLHAGDGRVRVDLASERARKSESFKNMLAIIIPISLIVLAITITRSFETVLMAIFVALIAFMIFSQIRTRTEILMPKILVDNSQLDHAPFNDATGAHAGALLGDVRHDPFQSGNLGTPAHERVEAGLIHKSHRGVLYIDEVATLEMKSQQQLLTAIQEKKYQITGQSELSSGAMVRTEAVPCDFIMVVSGNMETIRNMHPALRSRIRGMGYELVMQTTMPDNLENRRKLARFVAQEVSKDHRIPHFSKAAIEEIIYEARRRAGRKHHLSLLLRDLGGLVRAAGDLAVELGKSVVDPETVVEAKALARPLEGQITDTMIEQGLEYNLISTEGAITGRVNGLAVFGRSSGIVLPIEAEITPASSQKEGKIIATGQLRVIAREAVQNVSALLKKYVGVEISGMDVHIQFIGILPGGVEGDSASVTVAAAVISALENAPIRQDTAMTGSLSVRGVVLPIGGVTAKIEAAANIGVKRVIIPKQNIEDVLIEQKYKGMIEIIPVSEFSEVLRNIFPPEYSHIADKFVKIDAERKKLGYGFTSSASRS
ncbi:MAG: ATP-dependent protease LonB [Candidatus Kariarchaeaceae archaeon]